jgi:hypothetical protein
MPGTASGIGIGFNAERIAAEVTQRGGCDKRRTPDKLLNSRVFSECAARGFVDLPVPGTGWDMPVLVAIPFASPNG